MAANYETAKCSGMTKGELGRIADDLDDKGVSVLEMSKVEGGTSTKTALHGISREILEVAGVIRKALALFEMVEQMEKNPPSPPFGGGFGDRGPERGH